MQLLSEDDLDLAVMTSDELERAWDLWFDVAQTTNDDDPPYTHGVLVNLAPSGGKPSPQRTSATRSIPRTLAPRT